VKAVDKTKTDEVKPVEDKPVEGAPEVTPVEDKPAEAGDSLRLGNRVHVVDGLGAVVDVPGGVVLDGRYVCGLRLQVREGVATLIAI